MLSQPIVWIIYILTAAVGLYLFYKATGTYKILTIPITFLAFYLVFIYLGSPILFIQEGMTNVKYFIAVNAGMILIPIGMLIANKVFGFVPAVETVLYNQKNMEDKPSNKLIVIWTIAVILSIAACVIYILHLQQIPLIYGLTHPGDTNGIAFARQKGTTEFPYYDRYKGVFAIILPFLNAMVFAKYGRTREKRYLWLFMGLSAWNIFMLILNTEKAPAAYYILTMLVVYFIIEKRVRIKGIVVALLLIAGISLFMTYFKIDTGGEGSYLTNVKQQTDVNKDERETHWTKVKNKLQVSSRALTNRLLMGQTVGIYHYLLIFPDQHEFLKGQSFPNPFGIFPHKYFNTAQYVYHTVHPERPFKGTMPTVFFGDVYANFGYAAMLISMVVVGFILQSVEIYFRRSAKSVVNVAFYSSLFIMFGKLGVTDFFSAVFNTGTIAFALVYILFRYIYGEPLNLKRNLLRYNINKIYSKMKEGVEVL